MIPSDQIVPGPFFRPNVQTKCFLVHLLHPLSRACCLPRSPPSVGAAISQSHQFLLDSFLATALAANKLATLSHYLPLLSVSLSIVFNTEPSRCTLIPFLCVTVSHRSVTSSQKVISMDPLCIQSTQLSCIQLQPLQQFRFCHIHSLLSVPENHY